MASIRQRKRSDGASYYTVVIRLKGFQQVVESFDRITDARQWAQKTEAAMREGRLFPERKARRSTVKEMIEYYRQVILPSRPDNTRESYILDWWEDQIGHVLLSNLTPSVIAECKSKLSTTIGKKKKVIAASTQQKYIIFFGLVCRYAKNEWGLLQSNPVDALKKPSQAKGRDRVLTPKEIACILKCCKDIRQDLYLFTLLAVSCGCRWGEMERLEWNDVDRAKGYVTLRNTKNGDDRRVAIPQSVLKEIIALWTQRSLGQPLVFPNPLRSYWDNALAASNIKNFTFHDLRHTCATRLADSGASLLEIAQILGHRTMQMVKRYAHLTDASTKAPIDKMSSLLEAELEQIIAG